MNTILKNKSLFVFISQPDFACNCHALWEYITNNTCHETAWLVRKRENIEPLRKRGVRCELYNTSYGNDLLAQADYVIANTIFPALHKSEGQVFINLWHGSGIKAHDYFYRGIGNSQIRKLQKFSENTDLLCLHSLDDRFRLCAMLGFDIGKSIATGQPRLDCAKASDGNGKLCKIFGNALDGYERLILFVPSFRANAANSAGEFLSNNIFRLNDFDNAALSEFLASNNAVLVYKLHPIEQNTFLGIENKLNSHCLELTDQMLFDNDIRYDEILNAFDIMITDYSSIAFDWLLLDKPMVYLVPDYDDYSVKQGFVFGNISDYMPGEKVKTFSALLAALEESIKQPQKYHSERQAVIKYRFDFTDCKSAKRVYEAIADYRPIRREASQHQIPILPTPTTFLKKHFTGSLVIDGARGVWSNSLVEQCKAANEVIYITEEIPDESRSMTLRADSDILDLKLYSFVQALHNAKIVHTTGGVEYCHFETAEYIRPNNIRPVIGFAGAIDCRIWFAAVQAVSSAFPDYEIRFAGDIIGDRPAWLDNLSNLNYIGQVTYDHLPKVIAEFDVAILPMYGKYRERVPSELFWYLACGKAVVTAQMPNLPRCEAILQAKTIADFVEQTKLALNIVKKQSIVESAQEIARIHDWAITLKK